MKTLSLGRYHRWSIVVVVTTIMMTSWSNTAKVTAFTGGGVSRMKSPLVQLNGSHKSNSYIHHHPNYRSKSTSMIFNTSSSSSLASSASVNDEGEEQTQTQTQNQSTKNKLSQTIQSIRTKAENLPPIIQLLTLLVVYIFHLLVLTQHCLILPFQLIPNDQGRYQSIGLDSCAGIISMMILLAIKGGRDDNNKKQETSAGKLGKGNGIIYILRNTIGRISYLFSDVSHYKGNAPWNFPIPTREEYLNGNTSGSSNSDNTKKTMTKDKSVMKQPSARATSMMSLVLLVSAYFWTGRLSAMVELYLYAMAGMGVPLTIAMHRSLVVLGGHLAWVAIGSMILGTLLRPQPFFGGGNISKDIEEYYNNEEARMKEGDDTESTTSSSTTKSATIPPPIPMRRKYKWFTNTWKSNFLWWTMGGYFISSWFFNIADFLNQMILPAQVFELAGEGVVSQLINPENNDLAASLVGYIAPCISAPWWEEILYRGFLLPALCLQMKFWPAVFVSGVVFSVHHVSTTGALPLAILGWLWAAIYAKSGNLLVTILIHAMWNSRVFLGSWLGL